MVGDKILGSQVELGLAYYVSNYLEIMAQLVGLGELIFRILSYFLWEEGVTRLLLEEDSRFGKILRGSKSEGSLVSFFVDCVEMGSGSDHSIVIGKISRPSASGLLGSLLIPLFLRT